MELSKQVCSLELAKKLKELGVKQESHFWHVQDTLGNYNIWSVKPNSFSQPGADFYAAFTVAELGEMLPKEEHLVTMLFENGHCQMALPSSDNLHIALSAASQLIMGDTEADTRAKMLVYLLENKLIQL